MPAPKRGRGRPKTDPSTHSTVRLDLRVPPPLDAALRRGASKAGLTLAEYARRRLEGGDEAALAAAHEAGQAVGMERARALLEHYRPKGTISHIIVDDPGADTRRP